MSWVHQSDDEDEFDSSQQSEPNYGRAGIIFLVDCRKDMFTNDLKLMSDYDNGVNCCAFHVALQCCRETMIQKIKTGGTTMISVVFFGVENGDGSRKFISEFQSLSEPSPTKIKDIDALLSSNSISNFSRKYGHSRDAHLADVLSACLFNFSGCSSKLGTKRIFLFTKDDNPDGDYSDKQHQIRKRAVDLREADVDLELIPIGQGFVSDKFYQEIIHTVKKDSFYIEKPIGEELYLQDIIELVNKEHHRKRTLARLSFNIGNQVVIGVGLYGFTRKNRYMKQVYLCRKTNEQVRLVSRFVSSETSSLLRPYEVIKTTTIGSKDISFTTDELSKMRKVFEPSIVLLGFKDKACWQAVEQCHAPVFMFPDEGVVKGSSVLFKALLDRCIARDKVAVCVVVTRVGSRPRYALLVPQKQPLNDDGSQQLLPDGFLIYYLPFARMFGQVPVDSNKNVNVDAEKMQIVSQIIRKMKIKTFVADYFENPSLTKQWINIEALALQQDKPKEFVDTTLEHMGRLEGRLKNLSIQFNDIFSMSDDMAQPSKRKINSTTDSGPAKLIKRTDFIDLVTQRKVEKLTVAQLKDVLKCLPDVHFSQMKKNDLVELVYSNVEAIKKYI